MTTLNLERVECSCAACQGYCQHVPGWFLPREMEKAAALLNMTPEEFFKKYTTVDYWVGDTTFTLRPRTTREPGGQEAPYNPLGQCSFFQDGKCQIHAAKPHECAVTRHDLSPDGVHPDTADAWRPEQVRIVKLLGRQPEEQDGDIFDVLGLSFGF